MAAYENVLPSSTLKVTLLAFACFNGSIIFRYYINDDFSTIESLTDDIKSFESNCWTPGFYRDPESKQDYFITTKTNGTTEVHLLNIVDENEKAVITFEKFGQLKETLLLSQILWLYVQQRIKNVLWGTSMVMSCYMTLSA